MSRKPLKVIAGTPDKPLVIGDIEIPCYVLEDETRVLSQNGLLQAIGKAGRPVSAAGGKSLNPPAFLSPKNIKPFISKELIKALTLIPFQPPAGKVGHGYLAKLLPQICDVYLEARNVGILLPSQMHIAQRAEILMRGLATVGIIALVDEATGYQEIRAQRALAVILEKFIAKELQPWTKTFPYEFYELLYKLRGWSGPDGHKRTHQVAHDTNDLIYKRLAPGVLDELKRVNPVRQGGRRKDKHHQWFTPKLGHPKLKEHLAAVIALMRASANWNRFKGNLNRAFPKVNETIPLMLDDGDE